MPTLVTVQNTRRTIAIMMGLLFALTYWLYCLGFSAALQFDDAPSISGVSRVQDISSALAYLFDGRAGMLGRPLALATFLLQKDSWPSDLAAFFWVNTLIHLLNGLLVFCLSYQLTHFFPGKIRQSAWFALAVTSLWLTLPLHVPASLIAVQRMTTLSSTFILLGLIGYLSGRALLVKAPARAYTRMTLSVVIGTALALACKEIGATLIFYLIVLEVTIIRSAEAPADLQFLRRFRIFLGLPALLLVAYLVYSSALPGVYALRSFDLSDRLLTESEILWEYLGQIYLPARSGTGPYHDDYPVSHGLLDPSVTVAILAWMAALFGAWRLRKKMPVVLFALLWFLAGHLIESSFVPLELYFEHRNYLPSLGPLLMLCALAWQVPFNVQRIALAGLVVMVLLRMVVLGETTRTWGQPLLAARLWADEHPQSVRAVEFLAISYSNVGNLDAARDAILDGYDRIKDNSALALYSVALSCQHDSEAEFRSRLEDIQPVLSTGTIEYSVPELLNKMLNAQQQKGCPYLTLNQLTTLANLLLENPRYQASPQTLVGLHLFKNRIYALEGEVELSIQEVITAFNVKKEYGLALAAARVLANVGRRDEAIIFLGRAMTFAPRNPILRNRWKSEIDKLKLSIERGPAS